MSDAAPETTPNRPIPLPWNREPRYWFFVRPRGTALPSLNEALHSAGLTACADGFIRECPRIWGGDWQRVLQALQSCNAVDAVDVAVVGGEQAPTIDMLSSLTIPITKINSIASNLWLGEALMKGEITCYLQPVLSVRESIFGYEAFARTRRESGDIMLGGAIVNAGRALGIEYALDRHLQVEAIKTFSASGCGGFLFVNFLPGFIQRPEVYLEGLSAHVREHGIVPKYIVLDFTRSGEEHDVNHLKRVCEYCRSKGYGIALDDVNSVAATQSLVQDISPDYVKLDMMLAQRAKEGTRAYTAVREIVQICHQKGVIVIAEGVETEQSFTSLKSLEVDLFQGYYFSPPVSVEEIKRSNMSKAQLPGTP